MTYFRGYSILNERKCTYTSPEGQGEAIGQAEVIIIYGAKIEKIDFDINTTLHTLYYFYSHSSQHYTL